MMNRNYLMWYKIAQLVDLRSVDYICVTRMARKMITIFVLFSIAAISWGENVDCDVEKKPLGKAQPHIEPSFEVSPDTTDEPPAEQSSIDDTVEEPTPITSPVEPFPIESQPSPQITCDGINEIYDSCGPNTCYERCDQQMQMQMGSELMPCDPVCLPGGGCRCIDGYLRNDDGVCVPPDECPSICNENEVLGQCGNSSCIDRSCANRFMLFPCACSVFGGCVCKSGYFRHEDGGICIPESECPPMICEGINEVWSECGPNNCNNIPCDKRFTKMLCTDICILGGGCHCEPGFFRNDDGVCVPPEQCPPIGGTCPGENQEWSECGSNRCNDRLCSDLKVNLQCAAICDLDNPACICAQGYARDDDGNCIPIDQCPGICGKNQIWDMCGVNPCNQQFCYERFGDDMACIALCDTQNPGCRCDAGFYLDDQFNCIPEEDCPPNPCPGLNEKWAPCGADECNNIDCDKRFTPVACTKICNINGGCICKIGFYRNSSKMCVPENECPPIECEGDNEIFDVCGVNAFNNRSCENRFIFMLDPGICERDLAGCRCIDGFVRNKDGKCIKESECPVIECKANEVFDLCGPNSCTEHFCGESLDEICIMDYCTGEFAGCRCIEGFFRDKYDNCVEISKCPKCPENEVYNRCGSFCTEKRCDALINGPVCKPDCSGHFAECCCIEGFCRNKQGKCQKICTGKNEEYDWCGRSDCNDLSCSNRSLAPLCDPFCDPSAPNKCRCNTGFFRHRGICISAEECAKISESKSTGGNHWTFSMPSSDSCYISDKEYSVISEDKKKRQHHWSLSKFSDDSCYISAKESSETSRAKRNRKHRWSFSMPSSCSSSSH